MKLSFPLMAMPAFVASPTASAQTMEDLQAEIDALKAENDELMMMLNNSVTMEEAELMTMNAMIENFARQDWGALPKVRYLIVLGYASTYSA